MCGGVLTHVDDACKFYMHVTLLSYLELNYCLTLKSGMLLMNASLSTLSQPF